MFTGIVEAVGEVLEARREAGNLHLHVASSISHELKVDQSVSHQGVCLTVTRLDAGSHWVTAIAETLRLTNLNRLEAGDCVNLERCLPMGGRLDGHLVQGHVDAMAVCTGREEEEGSWRFSFTLPNSNFASWMISKGSITLNGVSLTLIGPTLRDFEVAIIPYTFEHTTFQHLHQGHLVNVEFDVVGKYLARHLEVAAAAAQGAAR
jgi:riboflavin synthase